MNDSDRADVDDRDRVDDSLAYLSETLEEIRVLADQASAQARRTRARRSEGQTYLEAVAAEEPPIVELVSRMTEHLVRAGSRLRRAQARALHEEGATMEEIAQLFGVTRQWVSALLRASQSEAGEEDEESDT